MSPVESSLEIETPDVEVPVATCRFARFVTRQPVLDAHKRLFGYALLSKSWPLSAQPGAAPGSENATVESYRRFIPELQSGVLFLACERDVLMSGAVTLLPPRATVFELTEAMEVDPEVVDRCRGLRARGYRFAIRDLVPGAGKRAFLAVTDFLEIDLRRTDATERKEIYALAKGSRAKLVAKNVHTVAEMEMARGEGCHYFQGYFFAEATIAAQKPIPASHIVYVRVLAALSAQPPLTSEIERIILSDSTLCYRLLRLVNSALYSLSTHVTSIRTALVLIGYDGIRKLVTIALAGMYADRQPKALSLLSLERAHFCESVAAALDRQPAELYLLGMFSLIDVMMQASMQSILDALPLSPEFKAALCGERNELGDVLAFLKALELGRWEECEPLAKSLGLRNDETAALYLEAVRWAATALVS